MASLDFENVRVAGLDENGNTRGEYFDLTQQANVKLFGRLIFV